MTICWKCNKILTTDTGERVEDAYFDSSIKKPQNIKDLIDDPFTTSNIYALCTTCYKDLAILH